MKKIYKNKILNIEGTDIFDNIFLFEYLSEIQTPKDRKIVYMKDLLKDRKNETILEKLQQKPAMWSEVYSPKDELEVFSELFEKALKNQNKIHIV